MTRPMGTAHVVFRPLHKWTRYSSVDNGVTDCGIPLDSFMVSGATTIRYEYPAKVLIPRHASESMCEWVYMMSYGGGLVEGDQLELQLDVHEQCCTLLTTQASTKIYHCEGGYTSRQTITCSIGPQALLAIIPDPLVPFKQARYSQTQKVTMSVDSNLVLLDWLTAGRVARGEVWQFDSVRSHNEVDIDGESIYRDVIDLQNSPHVTLQKAMGHYTVSGSLLLLGPLLRPLVKRLLAEIGTHKAFDDTYNCLSLTSVSPLQCEVQSGSIDGCVVRFLGPDTATIYALLDRMLKPLYPILGGNPFNK